MSLEQEVMTLNRSIQDLTQVLRRIENAVVSDQQVRVKARLNYYNNMSIDELELTVHAWNILTASKIQTVGKLMSMTEKRLLAIKGLGIKTLYDIQSALKHIGLNLARDLTPKEIK